MRVLLRLLLVLLQEIIKSFPSEIRLGPTRSRLYGIELFPLLLGRIEIDGSAAARIRDSLCALFSHTVILSYLPC